MLRQRVLQWGTLFASKKKGVYLTISSVGGGLELLEVRDGPLRHRCCHSVRPGDCVVLLCCVGSVVLGALCCAAEAFSPISQKLPLKKGRSVR